MRHRLFRHIALALAMALLCGVALAEVRTTGNVNLRSGPGKNYDIVTSFPEGKRLDYLGESSVDERGIAWYKVSGSGRTGWVSSMYSELIGESATPAATAGPAFAEPTATPAADGGVIVLPKLEVGAPAADADAAQPQDAVELSVYYGCDLVSAANEIGLISYRQVESEAPYQYYDNSMILAGNRQVENIVVYGGGYAVFGVRVGMTAGAAVACLNAAGLDYVSATNGITYEHRAAEDGPFFVDDAGHDSCINLWVNDEDIVTEIDWSTYTG